MECKWHFWKMLSLEVKILCLASVCVTVNYGHFLDEILSYIYIHIHTLMRAKFLEPNSPSQAQFHHWLIMWPPVNYLISLSLFPHMWNEHNNCTFLNIGFLWGLSVHTGWYILTVIKHSVMVHSTFSPHELSAWERNWPSLPGKVQSETDWMACANGMCGNVALSYFS